MTFMLKMIQFLGIMQLLSYSENTFSLRDNESTNGTYVDGELLTSGKFREVKSGAIVKFGNVELKFSINFS